MLEFNSKEAIMFKRVLLFLAMNGLVIATISILLNVFHVKPYLSAYGIDYRSLMIFCAIWGIVGALISLALSKQMAKWFMRIQIISPTTSERDLADLYRMVENLSRRAGLKYVPEVGVFVSNQMNAFATGPTQKHSLVAVSTALLNKMSRQEIEAVLGHEISHIANGDMITMTLLQGVVNAFVMFLARVLAFAFSGLGRDQNEKSNGSYLSYYFFTFVFEMIFMVLGAIIIATFSRHREFRADRGSADLLGKEPMIQALKRLESAYATEEIREQREQSIAALMISRKTHKGFLSLFATHPPIEKRIQHLKEGF